MPQQLLRESIQQSEGSAPAVQAAALLHCARVMTQFDKVTADQLLERGITVTQSLSDDDERSLLLEEFPSIAAGTNPKRAIELYESLEKKDWSSSDRLLFSMLGHRHIAEAVAYLTSPNVSANFSYNALTNAMADCGEDGDAQRTLLRSAMNAIMREPGEMNGFGSQSFLQVLNYFWMLLPNEEMKTFLHSFVRRVLDEPDQKGNSKLRGADGREVHFNSMQQQTLFHVFGPLRHIDPEFAESVRQTHSELAKAAAIYPYGPFGVTASAEPPKPAPKMRHCSPEKAMEWDFINFRRLPVAEWLKTTWEESFSQAMTFLTVDTKPGNPNLHPHEVWPSTQEFRVLMYKAGRYEGRNAAKRLDRIPNPDVRLLAKIELIAGIVGLPQLGGTSRAPRPIEDSPAMQRAKSSQAFTTLNLAALPIRWEGKGPARRVHTEFAACDAHRSKWGQVLRRETALFRRDGQLEESRGSLSDLVCAYDADGRLVSIEISGEDGPKRFLCIYDNNSRLVRVEQTRNETTQIVSSGPIGTAAHWGGGFSTTVFSYAVTPAGFRTDSAIALSIEYDGNGRPVVLSYTLDRGMQSLTKREWDAHGRLISENSRTEFPEAEFEMPSTDLRYEYDSRGRCTSMRTEFGEDHSSGSTFLYDDHDNIVEANSRTHDSRFEYSYDRQGNWTERVTWIWNQAKAEYFKETVERRHIDYFPAKDSAESDTPD
jgi:hypothetical protein